jgi:Bacterial TSP3 repeat
MKPAGSTRHRGAVAALVLLSSLLAAPLRAQSSTDCFPDRIVSFRPGTYSALPGFNTWQPGIVLGPPGDATPSSGSLRVMSLGNGGEIVLEFTDNEIVDGAGFDFILFENPFFCTAPPATAGAPYSVVAEPGIVAASEDGVDFRTFPYDAQALAQVTSLCTDGSLLDQLRGLMGLTPSFTGNYTVPDDPAVFDAAAPGGISGHGGDAFDLAAVGLTHARYLRITDANRAVGLPGSADGLDLDGAVALHSRPILPPGSLDSDGDGLSDDAERLLYGTDPTRPDSDGDGIPDGEEAASCRNPAAAGTDPFFVPSLDLEVSQAEPTLLRWNDLGGGIVYDAIRGGVAALGSIGGLTDLGVVTCLENDSTDLTTRGFADAADPPAGEAFFYLARSSPAGAASGYGLSTSLQPRHAASGDCQ